MRLTFVTRAITVTTWASSGTPSRCRVARRISARSCRVGERREVEAETHHLHLLWRRNTEPDQIFAAPPPRQRGHAWRRCARRRSTSAKKREVARRELALEDVTVERVDDDVRAHPGRHPSRKPAERPSFRSVRVHDSRPHCAESSASTPIAPDDRAVRAPAAARAP